MNGAPVRLLLLEDNTDDADLLHLDLADFCPGEFAVTRVERLADALIRLDSEPFDVVLSDLGLPDSTGSATVKAISQHAPELPLVVLTGLDDDDIGRAAIRQGAQDYLVKQHASGALMARTLRYAIERKRLEAGLKAANEALARRVAERTAELEAANAALRANAARDRALMQTAIVGIITADADGRILGWNGVAERMFGYAEKDVLGQSLALLMPQRYRERHSAGLSRIRDGGERHAMGRTVELHGLTRSGAEFPLELSLSEWQTPDGRYFTGIVRDITERKIGEQALARQKDLYDMRSRTNQAIVRMTGRQELFEAVCRIAVEHGHFLFAWIGLVGETDRSVRPVARYGEDGGYLGILQLTADDGQGKARGPVEQALRTGVRVVSNDFASDQAERAVALWRQAASRAGVRAVAAFPLRLHDAVIGSLNLYAGEPGFFGEDLLPTLDEMAVDVSYALDNYAREVERKRDADALRESEARFHSLTDLSSDWYWEQDRELRLSFHSSGFEKNSGTTSSKLLGMRRWEEPNRFPLSSTWDLHRATLEAHEPFRDFEYVRIGEDGEQYFVSLSGVPIFDAAGEFTGYRGIGRNITERKRAEQALRAAEEQFRGLVEQSIAGTYIIQDGKFAYVNPRFAEIFGYRKAEEIVGRDPLTVVAGEDRDRVAGHMRDLLRGEVANRSYEFKGVREDGSMIEVGVHGAPATHCGRPAVIGLIQDISEKKRAEEQVQRHLAQLEAAFMSTVQVATTLSEMRDPYTGGHERRVAEIAVAIGTELGLDDRRIEGLRVAGYLHDIGKITIPSEILSKPGRLSPIEYKLIQGHSQASHDVLKPVEFPWPVAQIILQHHERMDGSGYPQGLAGEAILLEARIMAVADVIEAMSSHRPYRPGLGIVDALAEIERGRGGGYDPDVADACLKLFREKGFVIPAESTWGGRGPIRREP